MLPIVNDVMCSACIQPVQKFSGDTLLKNLHPDLRLYVVKELSIPRPLGFSFLIFNFSFHSFHTVHIEMFIFNSQSLNFPQTTTVYSVYLFIYLFRNSQFHMQYKINTEDKRVQYEI